MISNTIFYLIYSDRTLGLLGNFTCVNILNVYIRHIYRAYPIRPKLLTTKSEFRWANLRFAVSAALVVRFNEIRHPLPC